MQQATSTTTLHKCQDTTASLHTYKLAQSTSVGAADWTFLLYSTYPWPRPRVSGAH